MEDNECKGKAGFGNDGDCDDNGKNVTLNKIITMASWIGASYVMFHKHMYQLFAIYSIFFILFPVIYVTFKFKISDCLNKDEIIDKGTDEGTVMLFEDSEMDIDTQEFIKNENLNANFWLVLISSILAYSLIFFF